MNVHFIHAVPVVEHNYCWVKECPPNCYLLIDILLIHYLIENFGIWQ